MDRLPTRWICDLNLSPPTLQDNTADADRLIGALRRQLETDRIELAMPLLKRLPEVLRRAAYRVRCLLFKDGGNWIVVHLAPVDAAEPMAGLAVDLGTSRVVLRLVDLADGHEMAETAFDNPQLTVGPDILARIHHADTPGGLAALQDLIIAGVNDHTGRLCHEAGCRRKHVHLAAVAGNTAMTHLFMGIDPHWLIREPYIPVTNRPGAPQARDLGLQIADGGRVLVFPNIGSYFGGDVIAGILFSGLHDTDGPAILVDVGTNAEVVLGDRNWMIACAGAAGPALEGGVTQIGMMAGPGVIDRVTIDAETGQFAIGTIADRPPVGICGSGVIDLAAQMFLAGMIDMRGRLVPDRCGSRYREVDGMGQLVVVPADASGNGRDLTIGQADLDSLTRSKAAMYTILETITGSVGIRFPDLSAFYVAGTFGSFIRPASAIAIGMLPDLAITAYRALGNSSLGGATLALASPAAAAAVDAIRDRITYMELNVNQDFMNRFSAAKFYPHTDPARFPSVTVRKPA